MKATTTLPQFKAVRRAGVPLCCIETADPAATIQTVQRTLNGKANDVPLLLWDLIEGLRGINPKGEESAAEFGATKADTQNPVAALDLMASKPDAAKKAIIFYSNAHLVINEPAVIQGVWNLRDLFKSRGATLTLLAPALTLPEALKQDVVIISEPLPGETELSDIIDSIVKDAEIGADKIKDRPQVIDTLRGLSAFAAEQVLAMSLSKEGIDQDGLWDRKRKMIEQTPGLQVWKGGESFEDLGGLQNLKNFLISILTSGNTPVRAIGFIDEIEKGLAGAAGDTSGTSQDQISVLLKIMQDDDIPGIILIGPGGTGKSMIAKAAGRAAKAPTIAMDLGAMKGSLVGESERKIRAAMDVFKAVSQGKGLFIATCNKIASLPPELRRRFTLGTFFVDLPDRQERATIWPIWLKKFALKSDPLPDATCDGWTGAEIRACCMVAFRTGLALPEAAKYVVPVIKSAPEQVNALRQMAHGKFISASRPGLFQSAVKETAAADAPSRKMEL